MEITVATIESMLKNEGRYYVPDRIRIAIEHCLEHDESAVTNEYHRLLSEFQEYENSMDPMEIDYRGPLTLDAYTTYYLSRNMFIPLIALRDLAFHPLFQDIPTSINVLDMGSGTGAIVFGLLSMFSNNPLSTVSLNITALDCCVEALDRQKRMIHDAGFRLDQIRHCAEDIRDVNSCIEKVREGSPYYLIFIANCLTEISHTNARDLVARLPEVLADNGAIIIAEAQRDYTKTLIKNLAIEAQNLGLNVYYPCSGVDCPYSSYPWCWV